jgi:hypothetical protein
MVMRSTGSAIRRTRAPIGQRPSIWMAALTTTPPSAFS